MDTKPKDTIIQESNAVDVVDYRANAATCDVCKFILTDTTAMIAAKAEGATDVPSVEDRIGLAFATALGFAQACGISGRVLTCCPIHGQIAVETLQHIAPELLKARAEFDQKQAEANGPKDAGERIKKDAAKPAAQRAN